MSKYRPPAATGVESRVTRPYMVIIGKYRPPGVGVHGAHCSAHGVGVHSAFRELVLLLVVIIDAEEAGWALLPG
jgi:hypothetical protein